VPVGEGVSHERGRQRVAVGATPKRRYFANVGSYSVKTVADGYRRAASDELYRFISIDDLERL